MPNTDPLPTKANGRSVLITVWSLPGEQSGGKAEHAEAGELRNDQGHHGGCRQYRPNRKVDPARQNDEGHTGREYSVDRSLLHDDRQVLPTGKAIRQQLEDDTHQEEHRQHAERAEANAQAIPHKLQRRRH